MNSEFRKLVEGHEGVVKHLETPTTARRGTAVQRKAPGWTRIRWDSLVRWIISVFSLRYIRSCNLVAALCARNR